MSGIPYNELQSLDCMAEAEDGRKVTVARIHWAFVIPCRDCRWCMAYSKTTYCDRFAHELPTVELDGFCAWGEKRDA